MTAAVSLSHPTDAERKAIIGITGQYRGAQATRVTVRLADLENAVRETTGRDLPGLRAELGGALRDRDRARRVRGKAWPAICSTTCRPAAPDGPLAERGQAECCQAGRVTYLGSRPAPAR